MFKNTDGENQNGVKKSTKHNAGRSKVNHVRVRVTRAMTVAAAVKALNGKPAIVGQIVQKMNELEPNRTGANQKPNPYTEMDVEGTVTPRDGQLWFDGTLVFVGHMENPATSHPNQAWIHKDFASAEEKQESRKALVSAIRDLHAHDAKNFEDNQTALMARILTLEATPQAS